MSREGLIMQFQARGLEVTSLQSEEQFLSVYQGVYTSENQKPQVVGIQVLTLPADGDYTQLEEECKKMISLDHPNILQLLGYFWENNQVSYFFVMVTESYEKDLGKDMKQRAENHFPWPEEDLWDLIFELVSAFTYLQKQNISHKNIKPESVFLTMGKNAKLGDFNYLRAVLPESKLGALAGTPVYLSPILRSAFPTRNPKVIHNSFKSDVFSLGMTLLSLILLGPPQTLTKVNLTNEDVQAVINTAPCSASLKTMLMFMLDVDEDTRYDFNSLNLWIGENPPRTSQGISLRPSIMEAVFPPSKQGTNVPYLIVQEPVHIEAPRSQQQEDLAPKSKPSHEVLCLLCGNAVDRGSATAKCDVVQLYCNPPEHMFCSRECCREFLDSGHTCCPQCNEEIPNETVVFYRARQSVFLRGFQPKIETLALPVVSPPSEPRTESLPNEIEMKTREESIHGRKNAQKGIRDSDSENVARCRCICW